MIAYSSFWKISGTSLQRMSRSTPPKAPVSMPAISTMGIAWPASRAIEQPIRVKAIRPRPSSTRKVRRKWCIQRATQVAISAAHTVKPRYSGCFTQPSG